MEKEERNTNGQSVRVWWERGRGALCSTIVGLAIALGGCAAPGPSRSPASETPPAPTATATSTAVAVTPSPAPTKASAAIQSTTPVVSPSATTTDPAASVSPATESRWTVVVLGDSEATGSGAPEGRGWADAYAELIREGRGHQVELINLAESGMTSSRLLLIVGSTDIRDALARADIVVLGIGGADLNSGDNGMLSGTCKGIACYEPIITKFATNLDEIVAEVRTATDGRPTVLRAITSPNVVPGGEDVIPAYIQPAKEVGLYQTRGMRDAICAAMAAHDGACIDSMTAFNGADGTGDAYKTGLISKSECCYPTEKGQRLMAELLYATGLEPLDPPTGPLP